MKKCLKCGTKYEDKFMFCPECGEKLVPSNECPNCHLEVSPNAKFCPNCGTKLNENAAPAPQVEPAIAPAPVVEPQPQPVAQPYQQPEPQPRPQRPRKSKQEIMRIVSNFVYMGMYIFIALFYLIGIFGDPFNLEGYMYGQLNFTIFFRYDIIAHSGGAAPFIVLLFLFYYLAFAGFIVTLATGIPSVIRAFKQKDQPINTKPMVYTIMFILPHLMYLSLLSPFASMMGWGSIMLLLSTIYAAFTIAIVKALGGELRSKPIVANALNGSAILFASLGAIYGGIAACSPLLAMIADVSYIESYVENGQFFLALGIFLTVLAGSILMYIAVPKTRNRDGGIKAPVILQSIAVGLITIGFVLSIILYKQAVKEIVSTFSTFVVFFLFTLGLLIAANKIDPKAPVVPQQTYRPQPQPVPAPQGQPQFQPMPGPQPMPMPQPMPAPQPVPAPEPQPAPQPVPAPQPEPAPQPQPMDNNNPYKL